jgi:hypothetical protein
MSIRITVATQGRGARHLRVAVRAAAGPADQLRQGHRNLRVQWCTATCEPSVILSIRRRAEAQPQRPSSFRGWRNRQSSRSASFRRRPNPLVTPGRTAQASSLSGV